jgi:hypothetical protein
MHDTIFLLSSAVDAASRHRWTAQLPNLRVEGKVVNNPKKKDPTAEIYLCAIISKPLAQMASTILALSSRSATLSFCCRNIDAC